MSQELEAAIGETGPSSTEVEGERDDEILASKHSSVNGFCPVICSNGGNSIDHHHHHDNNNNKT